ncbi:hypothetical protein BLNAU_17892 [Blattamonas nauphoetae]|uniref:Uncharacterized protein n=1 Tax=Blattamonas nauphoetae TaxID=2049346 RepID=A0ABQ9X920_9EUKA|nr:hypothetical protein BLNAU_17892 [Blattamonas nauphoetae]
MTIPPETANDLLFNSNPSLASSPENNIRSMYPRLPTVKPTLAQSVEGLIEYAGGSLTSESFDRIIYPFSSLFFMSTVMNYITTLPNRSDLQSSLVAFIADFGSHRTIIRCLGFDSGSWFHSYLSINSRRILLNLMQFLSDEDASRHLEMISQHYGALKEEKSIFGMNLVILEVLTLLPDSPDPSPQQIEEKRSYIKTHFNSLLSTYLWCTSKQQHERHRMLKCEYCSFLSEYVKQEIPSDNSRLLLRLFPCTIQVPDHLLQEVVFVILRSKSLKDHDFCFSVLSGQEYCFLKRRLEPPLFLELVEKAVSLIRTRLSISVHRTVYNTFLKWVDWDELELSFMFLHLLPLLSETVTMISSRRKVEVHTEFLEHVAVKGINKLWTTNMSESQRRHLTTTLVLIGLNLPTTKVIDKIMTDFAFKMRVTTSASVREIQDLVHRVLIEEGCEEFYASAALDTPGTLKYGQEMNNSTIRSAVPRDGIWTFLFDNLPRLSLRF